MNILGRDKSFYGQYKFLTSHSIFIVSSNIYRYHSCYVPRRCIVVALLLRPRLWFLYALYIIHIFFFLLLSLLPPSCREKFKHIFQTRLNVSRSPITSRDTRIPKRFYSKKKKKKRKRRRKGKASIDPFLSPPLWKRAKEISRKRRKATMLWFARQIGTAIKMAGDNNNGGGGGGGGRRLIFREMGGGIAYFTRRANKIDL